MENTEEMSNITEEQQDVACSEEQQMETNTAEKTEETVTPAHPYQDELSQFQPHTWQLEEKEPQMYSSLDDTKFTMVDSQSLLNGMMLKLKEVTELGIAMEHHNYRTFHGMVCLVLISTRTEDFLIDPLILKEELKVLNEVCTDSNILKVMYGSIYNIKWLLKDFGIYVINMFDTRKAAQALIKDGEPSLGSLGSNGESLSNILEKYCNIVVNKEHVRADWRVRPLPDHMVKYAREEAHFLLYIQDVFRNALLKKKALEDVYKACTDSCGYVWDPDKHTFRPDSYISCYKRNKRKMNVQQLECFRLLYEWRYNISKENDEGTGYMLPDRTMIKISKALPKEAQGIVNCCDPVPPFVEQNLEDVHKLVLLAIKNVPEVPKDPVKEAQILAIKNSKKKKTNQVKTTTTTATTTTKKTTTNNNNKKPCFSCGRLGHMAKDCVNQNNAKCFGGMRPPGGPWMRGGPGFRGRGTRPIHNPYGHLPPNHPLRGHMYDAMDGYNNAGPYNEPFNPYNQHPRFDAGGWW